VPPFTPKCDWKLYTHNEPDLASSDGEIKVELLPAAHEERDENAGEVAAAAAIAAPVDEPAAVAGHESPAPAAEAEVQPARTPSRRRLPGRVRRHRLPCRTRSRWSTSMAAGPMPTSTISPGALRDCWSTRRSSFRATACRRAGPKAPRCSPPRPRQLRPGGGGGHPHQGDQRVGFRGAPAAAAEGSGVPARVATIGAAVRAAARPPLVNRRIPLRLDRPDPAGEPRPSPRARRQARRDRRRGYFAHVGGDGGQLDWDGRFAPRVGQHNRAD